MSDSDQRERAKPEQGPWHLVQLLLLGVVLGVVLYAGYLVLPLLAFE